MTAPTRRAPAPCRWVISPEMVEYYKLAGEEAVAERQRQLDSGEIRCAKNRPGGRSKPGQPEPPPGAIASVLTTEE